MEIMGPVGNLESGGSIRCVNSTDGVGRGSIDESTGD